MEDKMVIIDVADGNITGKLSKDKVILSGVYPSKDSKYVENIEIVLNRENDTKISIEFPYDGYNMQLFIGDFTGDNKSEIMVRGAFGGSGGFEIGVIYKYEDGKLVKIFDQNNYVKEDKCTAKYADNYKIHINCGKRKYSLDISSRNKDYLNELYNADGKVKENYKSVAYVDAPNGIYPIKQVYNDYYELLIQQRIVGISNSDTLAVIQTLVSLEDSNLEEIYKGLLFFPYKDLDRKKIYKSKKQRKIELSEAKRDQIYYSNEFNVERENLDLIVNLINEDSKTLYIDGYLINLKNTTINKINNIKLELYDNNGRKFAEKTFNDLGIEGGLKPYEGKRVFLSFFENEYSLFNVDTSNISWKYTYNVRD